MESQTKFLLKVLILSLVLSGFIKYAGPSLNVAATSINAIILVFLPTVVLATALLWRLWQQQQPN